MIQFIEKITQKELSLLIALQENPLATYDWLSERVGLAKSIVFGLFKSMTVNPKPLFSVTAMSNLWNLGLNNIDVLIEVDNEQKIQLIENLCFEHPYTYYRARCFGDINGMFTQFTIPGNTTTLLDEFFFKLKSKQIVDNYNILPFTSASLIHYTTPNVDFWNPTTQKWDFFWKDWLELDVPKIRFPIYTNGFGCTKSWMTKADVAIIKELVKNARRKNLDFIDSLKKDGYDFTPQTFSRRLKRVQDECISKYRLFVNPGLFDLYTSVLITGKGEREKLLELLNRAYTLPIPFNSTLKIHDENAFWYLHLPPTHLSDLLVYLRKILYDMKFNYIDYVRASSYLPWPETYSDKHSDWIGSKEFMVDELIKKIT